ncbi:hypothetical protein BC828DRAFT_401868 [Blastocladiella britannica]|nr:hypothetical protein BC828DRAFT_401868 [Blastocladiella britannica]
MAHPPPHPSLISATLAKLGGQSPYALLGVSPKASGRAVKAAFRTRALAMHPDRHMKAADLPAVRERFAAVKLAYDVLNDRHLRSAYDHYLLHRPLGTGPGYSGSTRSPPYHHQQQQKPDPTYTRFDDADYAGFSYERYAPPTRLGTRFGNASIAAGVLAFAVFGASVQWWRYQHGSSLVRAAIARENATNMSTLAHVRARAIGRSSEEFHREIEEHIAQVRLERAQLQHQVARGSLPRTQSGTDPSLAVPPLLSNSVDPRPPPTRPT